MIIIILRKMKLVEEGETVELLLLFIKMFSSRNLSYLREKAISLPKFLI
jgi:hypothetical protein